MLKDFNIPEVQKMNAKGLDSGLSGAISGGRSRLEMTVPVNFNRHPERRTIEVDHKGFDVVLSSKLVAQHLAASQLGPEVSSALGVSLRRRWRRGFWVGRL
jgi:hypothetical protein